MSQAQIACLPKKDARSPSRRHPPCPIHNGLTAWCVLFQLPISFLPPAPSFGLAWNLNHLAYGSFSQERTHVWMVQRERKRVFSVPFGACTRKDDSECAGRCYLLAWVCVKFGLSYPVLPDQQHDTNHFVIVLCGPSPKSRLWTGKTNLTSWIKKPMNPYQLPKRCVPGVLVILH